MRPRFWPRLADQAITLTLCRRSRKRGSAVVSRWGVVASLVVAVGAAFGCLFAARSEAGSPPARVVAVVPSPTGLRLRQLDAQTLAPVRGGWSRAAGVGTAMAVSPTGALVAVTGTGDKVLLLRANTGKVVRTQRNDGLPVVGVYWLGA